tara:strand:- start:1579 stop:3504 length:1926 start_codon:yes stop_codon:yes gene_type:complete
MCKTFQLYFLLLIFLFSFIIAEQSTDNEQLFKQGITFERMGKFELAENIYLELLNSDPKNSRFYFQLKSLYKRNNSYLKLEKLLENRIKLFPKDFQTKVEIGDIYFKSNNKEKAIEYWDDLLFEFKSNKTIYYLLFQIFSANELDKKLSSLVEKGRLEFNEPNFLSYELGNYKSAKLDFYGSIQEYLKFLKTNPNQLNIISSKILVFSDDSKNKNIIEKSFDDFFIKNNKINNKVIVHVFIDFLLKTKNYSEALNQLFFLPLDDENDYQFQINFANNLRNEKEIEASIQVYSNILTSLKSENQLLQKSLSKLTGKILYGIALSYEQKIKPDIETKLISGLFSNNFFFQSKIFVNKNFSTSLINETFSMYDSILIKTNENDFSSQAHYRIGELRYLINNDFQGAINSYKSASNNDNRNISLKSNLRISDVYFTSGEIKKSIFHLENMTQNSNFDSKEKELIKINLIKKYFLNGELDKCEFILSELILSIKYEDKFFNDLIELKRYIDKHFSKNDDYNKSAFLNYLIGEKYLAQNKIVESISFFQKVLDNYDKTSIIPETTFRLAQINQHLENYQKSISLLESLENTNLESESIVLISEIMDKNLDDKIQAEKLYFQFLEDFPKSIYTEPIRFRLRQIKGEEF